MNEKLNEHAKKWNLYIFLQGNTLINIKISIIDICYTNMAPIPKTLMFSYFMNEKFNEHAKVEKFTNMLRIAVRLIVIDLWCTERSTNMVKQAYPLQLQWQKLQSIHLLSI